MQMGYRTRAVPNRLAALWQDSGVAPSAKQRLQTVRLYLVIDAGAAPSVVPPALEGGVDILQLREKEAGDEEIVAAGRELAELCRAHDAIFIVNDRPDLALACGADGVHVGQQDQPVEDVRREVGDELIVGLSTHSPEQFEAGLRSSADYLCIGPVWATPTKPGRPAVGLDPVRFAARHATKPFFAIGGIDAGNIDEVRDAGAERVVVVRAIRDAEDPRAAAAALRGAPVGAQ
jgi:thiamine-phosphate pyrophosphorylase